MTRARLAIAMLFALLTGCGGLIAATDFGDVDDGGLGGSPPSGGDTSGRTDVDASKPARDAAPGPRSDAATTRDASDAAPDAGETVDAALPPPALSWARLFGGVNMDTTYRFAVDPSGNVYVLGSSNGALTLDGVERTCKGAGGGFVSWIVKLDTNGVLQWANAYCAAQFPTTSAAAVDGAGRLILAGNISGKRDFGAGSVTSTGNQGVFVAAYDPDGTLVFARVFDGSGIIGVNSMALDSKGDIFVVGPLKGTIDFGEGPRTNVAPEDILFLELDPNGNLIAGRTFGGASSYTTADAIAIGTNDVVFMSGMYVGSGLNLGGGALPTTSLNVAYLASFDSAGAYRFAKSFGAKAQGNALAADHKGRVALGGLYVGEMNFGPGALPTGENGGTPYVTMFDEEGTPIWSHGFIAFGDTNVGALAFRTDGDLVFSGNLNGGSVGTIPGVPVMAVARLAGDTGATRWVERSGGPNIDSMNAIATDPSGATYFAGSAESTTVDFGEGPIPIAGDIDSFVGKLAP